MRKFLKFLAAAFIFAFLLKNIISEWSEVAIYLKQLNPVLTAAAFTILLSVYPEGALGWYVILRKMGIAITAMRAIRIWIIANVSRYIPGTVWQYLGRVELTHREVNVSRSKIIGSLIVEIALVLTAAIITSSLALPFVGFEKLNMEVWIFFIPIPLVLLHPAIANKIIYLIAKVSKKEIQNLGFVLNLKDIMLTLPLFILNFLLNGMALFFLVMAFLKDLHLSQAFAFSGFYALSWTLGRLSIITPAGIGVTEASLAYLLSFSMPFSLASVIALSYRFLLSLAELFTFLFFMVRSRR